jgi:hypothetical protein
MVDIDLKDVKFKTEDGEIVDFGDVKTTDDLKEKIRWLGFPYCKNCGFYKQCNYKSRDDDCGLLLEVLSNYIDMNIKSTKYKNSYDLENFIKSCFYIVHLFKDFLDWMGIYSDKELNLYLESDHPHMNSLFSHNTLIKLSKYLESVRNINPRRIKKFAVLVEGPSDKIILSKTLRGLDVLGIDFDIKNSVKIVTLDSNSRAKKDAIKSHLRRFRELDCDYFLILDGDAKSHSEELIRENLIDENHVLVFDKDIEDEYPLDKVIEFIEKISPHLKNKFDKDKVLDEINTKNKSIKEALESYAHENSFSFVFNDLKMKLAEKISEEVLKELEDSQKDSSGCIHGDWKPTSSTYEKLVEGIRPLAKEINKISKDFFVETNDK